MVSSFTGKQKAFIHAYIDTLNATEAARRAGYKGNDATLRSVGSENLTKPNIRTEVDRILAERVMTSGEVLARITDTARTSMADFVKIDATSGAMTWDFKKAQEAGRLHQIKKISYGKYGITLELYDRQRAEETLARHYGLLKDNLTIDVNLIVTAVEALKEAGFDPAETFQKMIERVQLERNRQTPG